MLDEGGAGVEKIAYAYWQPLRSFSSLWWMAFAERKIALAQASRIPKYSDRPK
jgi:hypothetical protein